MRSKQLMRTKYDFARKSTSSSSSERPFRAIWYRAITWWFNWRTYGSVTLAIWDRAMTWSFLKLLLVLSLVQSVIMRVTWYFMKFWPMTVWAIWSDLIGFYGFIVRKERSDWIVHFRCPEGAIRLACTLSLSWRSDPIGLYAFVVLRELSNWLVRFRCLEGAIWLAGIALFSRQPHSLSQRSVFERLDGLLVLRTSDSSVAENKKTIRKMRLVLRQFFRLPCRCA